MKRRLTAILLIFLPLLLAAQQPTPALPTQQPTPTPTILTPPELEKLIPPTVFFQGKTAPIQLRNAAGVRFPPASYLLTALVDTSGYSSNIQARYQAYLLTDTTLSIEGHTMPPGAYGIGFLPGDPFDQFVVMDLSGHDLFLAPSTQDPTMRRPRPLQILADPANPTQFRLYEGRTFVAFIQTPPPR